MNRKQEMIDDKQRNKTHLRVVVQLFLLMILFVHLKIKKKEILGYKKSLKRMQKLYTMVNLWLSLEICHKDLMKILLDNKYKKIAIYGMGELGKRVVEKIEISETINVLYGIDQNAENIETIIPVYCLEEIPLINTPDVVILTTYCENGNLFDKLQKKFQCPIINIEELLNETR